MRRLTRLMLVVITAAVVGNAGCSMEEGWQDGVSDGVSSALSALIQAPIDAWIADRFAAEAQ